MYSPLIIDRRLYQARKSGIKFRPLPREESIDIAGRLERLRYDADGKPLPEGQLVRPLNTKEQAFINSERILCKCDFSYYYTRYHKLELDPGVTDKQGIGPSVMLESQIRYVTLLGRREEECYEEQAKYKFTEGIHAYFHKARQVVATSTARGATMHRMILWPGTRCMAGTLDDTRITELFTRDHIALDNLPFWMKPRIKSDVKDTEMSFEHPTSSRISYQAENQRQGKGGLGVGSQIDVSHLTEVALWDNPGFIRFSFWPAIPKAITTLHIQESTAEGKGGYWYEVTEAARKKKPGYENWIYAFIPWYMNRNKYRSNVPIDWVPAKHTISHAALVERTSPEFFDGKTIHLSLEQMYWWEKTRAAHVSSGELATFLTNYPATPEQSFQSPSRGALPVELLEEMETELENGIPFDLELAPQEA